MADKITWADKESLVTDPTIAEKNKVTDDNMNEIKSVTNTNADQLDETIVYDENNITTNTKALIKQGNYRYINSEIAIGSNNDSNRPVWFKQGINIFNSPLELGGFNPDGSKASANNMYRNTYKVPVKPNTTYTSSINGVAQQYVMYYYDINGNFLSNADNRTGTFTTPDNCYSLNFRCFVADFTSDYANLKIQFQEGSIATAYETYVTPEIIAGNYSYIKPTKINLAPYRTSAVNVVTRAYAHKIGNMYVLNIAVSTTSTSTGTKLFENLPFKPSETTELNCVNNNNNTTRCLIDANGDISINATQSTAYYINGIIVVYD